MHGFYSVNGKQFFNKLEAIREAQSTGTWPHWNFHEAEYTKHNWQVEPTKSLQQLYIERALELRSQYDYLVLHYSGGNDSNQILQAFIDARVKIDEISIRTAHRDRPNDTTDLRSENTFAGYSIAYQNALWVQNTLWPGLKISELNVTDAAIKNSNDPNWQNRLTSSISIVNTWRDYDLHTGTRSIANRGVKVAHILGIDKPTMGLDEHGWFVQFVDKIPNNHINLRAQMTDGLVVEFFYWANTTAPVIIKQAHTLLSALASGAISQKHITGRDTPSQNAVASIIYKHKFTIWAEEKPSMPGVVKNHEAWIYSDSQTDQFAHWVKTLREIDATIEKRFLHGSALGDLVGNLSPKYYVKKFND